MRDEMDLFCGEYDFELGVMNDFVKTLDEIANETPDAACWAEYKMVGRKKIYTGYELILPRQMEPLILTGDQYETVPVKVLLDWYRKRYTQMCIENFKENEKES